MLTSLPRSACLSRDASRPRSIQATSTRPTPPGCSAPRCAGVDHMDFTADGRYALVSCEFAGRMIVVDLRSETVVKTIELAPGATPQDVKLAPDGRAFYVADMTANGVWVIDAATMSRVE